MCLSPLHVLDEVRCTLLNPVLWAGLRKQRTMLPCEAARMLLHNIASPQPPLFLHTQ